MAPDAEYAIVEYAVSEGKKERLILAEALLGNVLRDKYQVIDRVRGDELAGLEYEPLFWPFHFDVPGQRLGSPQQDRASDQLPETYTVISGDFVSMEDGTGIVHIAPAFGEVDYEGIAS